MSKHPNRKRKPGDNYRADVEFKCPECGAECGAGTKPEPFVTHKEPACPTFMRLEPGAFCRLSGQAMRAARLGVN